MSEEVVVFVTCPSGAAEDIAKQLIESELAACVNIIPAIKSVYRWQGQLNVDNEEALLIIKSSLLLWTKLEAKVLSIHSYDVPEIICVPIVEGHNPYLMWLNGSMALPL
jgi:periplasmic divalent cation tolerance protein